ncbi:hypothetical protein Dimus_036285 [Dionaea muscipula]
MGVTYHSVMSVFRLRIDEMARRGEIAYLSAPLIWDCDHVMPGSRSTGESQEGESKRSHRSGRLRSDVLCQRSASIVIAAGHGGAIHTAACDRARSSADSQQRCAPHAAAHVIVEGPGCRDAGYTLGRSAHRPPRAESCRAG